MTTLIIVINSLLIIMNSFLLFMDIKLNLNIFGKYTIPWYIFWLSVSVFCIFMSI